MNIKSFNLLGHIARHFISICIRISITYISGDVKNIIIKNSNSLCQKNKMIHQAKFMTTGHI